jgi:alpha-beta hydrolase superfamily lysophospholipase
MSSVRRWVARAAVVLGFVTVGGATWVTRSEAHRLLSNPKATRVVSQKTPADAPWRLGDARPVDVRSKDGTALKGWFVPADSDKLILVQHGYKDKLEHMFGVAALLHKHGYQVMLMCVRAHDGSDGELVGLGMRGEMDDMAAWATFANAQPGVDPAKVGMFGVSMGGSLAIQYTADHPEIRALVADSAFSSLDDTIDTSVKFFTGLPPFPFGPMIRFWAETKGGFDSAAVDAKRWIGRISPRPVLVMQGGADVVVSPASGQRLFDAAGQPKEFWFEPAVGHGKFLATMPEAFESRVVGFFDREIR